MHSRIQGFWASRPVHVAVPLITYIAYTLTGHASRFLLAWCRVYNHPIALPTLHSMPTASIQA